MLFPVLHILSQALSTGPARHQVVEALSHLCASEHALCPVWNVPLPCYPLDIPIGDGFPCKPTSMKKIHPDILLLLQ